MSQLLFDFKDFATPKVISKKITTEFNKAANVTPVNVEISPKTRRDSGVSFREIFAMFADNQTVTLRVKQSGDIYKVLINNKLLPIKNQDNHAKAIGEICSAMDKGRSAFQKKLAKTKITLPPSVKSTIVSKQQALDDKKAALLEAIDAVQNELNVVNAEIDDFQNKIDAGNKTISDAQVIMPDSQHNTTSVAELTREATDRLNQHADQPSGQDDGDNTSQNNISEQDATPAQVDIQDTKAEDKKFLNDMFFASESTFQSEDDVQAALAKVKEIEQKYSATDEFKSLISQAEESLNGLLNISNTSHGSFLKQRIDMFKKTIQDKEALFNSIDVSKIDVDKSEWDANEKIIKDASNKIAEIENKINNGISIFEFQSVADELNRIMDDIPDTALQQFLSDINYFVDLWQTKIIKEKDNWSDSDIARAVDTLKNFKANNIENAGQAFVSAAINYVNEIDEMINTLSQSLNKAPSELETLVKNKLPDLDDAMENLSKQLGNKEIRKVSNLPTYSIRKVLRTDPALKSYLDSLPDKSIASNIRAKLEAIPPEEIKKPFDEHFDELNRKYSDDYGITDIRNLAEVLTNYDFCLDSDVFKKDNVNNLTDEQKIEMIEATNPNIYMYSKTREYNAHPEKSLMTDTYCKKVGINLTNADKLAIFSYIGPSMNSMLNFANNEGIWSPYLETYSEILSQALNKLPKYQGTIMRGELFKTEYDFLSRLNELKSNSSYVKSFLSTTIKKNTANDYAGWVWSDRFSIKMNIKAKSAVFIDFMVMPKLQQLILPKGAKLKYISHEISGDDNNKCEIFLEEI